ARDADPDTHLPPLAFSPDGRTLVTACWKNGDMWVDARPVAGGPPRRLADSRWLSGSEVPYAARFTPDGKLLAIHDGRTWEVREFAANRLLYTVPAGLSVLRTVTGEFTPDGKWFVAVRDPYRLIAYDAATGA